MLSGTRVPHLLKLPALEQTLFPYLSTCLSSTGFWRGRQVNLGSVSLWLFKFWFQLSFMKILLPAKIMSLNSDVFMCAGCGVSPHHQATLRHQLGVLHFNSTLTLSTRGSIRFHILRDLSYNTAPPTPLKIPIVSPGCHLGFGLTIA